MLAKLSIALAGASLVTAGFAQTAPPEVLAGVRDYPDSVSHALADLSAEPSVVRQMAENPSDLKSPETAKPPIPERVRAAVDALRNFPEIVDLAAEYPEAAAALRNSYVAAPAETTARIVALRERYRAVENDALALWQDMLEHDPVALSEYAELLTNYSRSVLKEAPRYAIAEVLDRGYYTACPPDAQIMSLIDEKGDLKALARVAQRYWDRFSPEDRDARGLQRASVAALTPPAGTLGLAPPEARKSMWRAVSAGTPGEGGGVIGLVPVVLQPRGDLDSGARLARAMFENGRLWSEFSNATERRPVAQARPQVSTDLDGVGNADVGDTDLTGVSVVDDSGTYVDVPVGASSTYTSFDGRTYYGGTLNVGTYYDSDYWSGCYGFSYPFVRYSPASSFYYPPVICTTRPGYVSASDYYNDLSNRYHGWYAGYGTRRYYRDHDYTRVYRPQLNPNGYPLAGNPRANDDCDNRDRGRDTYVLVPRSSGSTTTSRYYRPSIRRDNGRSNFTPQPGGRSFNTGGAGSQRPGALRMTAPTPTQRRPATPVQRNNVLPRREVSPRGLVQPSVRSSAPSRTQTKVPRANGNR